MAEYNILFLDLNNRLSILKARLPYLGSNVSDSKKEELRKRIDTLLKELDNDYSEGKYLTEFDSKIAEIESEF